MTASDVSKRNLTKRKKRRFQFSLRVLMLVMLASAAVLVWYGSERRQVEREQEAIRSLVAVQGKVFSEAEWENHNRPFGEREADVPKSGLPWLRRLLGEEFFYEVHAVNFHFDYWSSERGNFQLSEPEFRAMAVFPKLRLLGLSHVNLGDADFQYLGEMPHLHTLELDYTYVTDAGLANLRLFPNLERLSLANNDIHGVGLEYVANLQDLKSLDLSNVYVDEGLHHLQKCRNLEVLNLWGTSLYDGALQDLSGLPLKSLDLLDCDLRGDKWPAEMNFPYLEVLAWNEKVTPEFIHSLDGLPRLQVLNFDVDGWWKISEEEFLSIIDNVPNLREICLRDAEILPNELRSLTQLKKLRKVDLRASGLSDDDLKIVAQIEGLQELLLSETQVTSAGLVHLKDMTSLRELYLGWTGVDVTALPTLKRMKWLRTLDVGTMELSKEQFADLCDALPECEVRSDEY